jgi:FtsP/CotA-like multicopper oxidase with cupredoxin domain
MSRTHAVMRRAGWRAHLILPVALLTAAAVLALLAGPKAGHGATADGDPYHVPTVVDTNPNPKIVETTLTAEPATVDIGHGVKAHALTFNGSIPGPTLRLNVGDTVIVHFRNHLNERTGIHWHGIELANAMDGTPLTQDQVKPGGSFRYQFKVTRPGIFWYHPHHHGSANQVFKGMYGEIVVRDPVESVPPASFLLPDGGHTVRAVLSDMTVCKAPGSNDAVTYDPGLPHVSDGPLPAQAPPTPKDLCETHPIDADGNPRAPFAAGDIPNIQQNDALANPANEGQTVLTNGVNVGGRLGSPANPGPLAPGAKVLSVVANDNIRLQLVNASTVRYMRLRMSSPSGKFVHLIRVGGEGGLLDKSRFEGGTPVVPGTNFDSGYFNGEILLPPGGRADVVVRMRSSLGPVAPPEPGIYTLWTEDFLRTATGFANTPTVPVMHFAAQPPIDNILRGLHNLNEQLRPADDPVEALSTTPFTPLDPASFPTPKPGLASPNILLNVDPHGFGVDGIHGEHDPGGDFMQAPHVASARYVQPGRTYEMAVTNGTGSRHPFHLHGFSIQPLSLTKHLEPTSTWDYHEFVDTVDIPPGYTLHFRVRIDPRPLAGNASLGGGELGRWAMHCHIFSHAESGMISELVVTGNVFEDNERPQMTIDNVDVTGIRGRTVTATGTYRDPDGNAVTFLAPRDAATDELLGKVTKDGTDHGRWTWTYPVSAGDHDRDVKIAETDDHFDVNQMVVDLHVKDAPTPPAPTPTPTTTPTTPTTPTPTPTPAPTPTGGQPQPGDQVAPVIRGLRARRLARAVRVRLRLSEPARLTVTIKRHGHRVARKTRGGETGRTALKVRKRLRPGRYTVVARAVDAAGNRARPAAVRLRVAAR